MIAVSDVATRPLYDATDSLLRFAMRVDATLTGLAGLAVAAVADPFSASTGLTSAQQYLGGAFFVFYGLAVFTLAALPNLRRVGIIVAIANVGYTLAAVAVVVVGSLPLTAVGVTATLASAVYTALFAVLQYLGVRRLAA